MDQIVFNDPPEDGAEITANLERGDFRWGCGSCEENGISNHPVKSSGIDSVISMNACSGTSETIFSDAGCFDSQCEYHDNQSLWSIFYSGTCSHCPSGYTDMGFYCGKGTWPWEWRTTSIHYYGLDYPLSQNDYGLSRTR